MLSVLLHICIKWHLAFLCLISLLFFTLQVTRVTQINDTFCGAPKNVGIGSRYRLDTNANITSDTDLATTLGIIIDDNTQKTIAVIGTDHGKVVKVSTLFTLVTTVTLFGFHGGCYSFHLDLFSCCLLSRQHK